MGPVTRHLRDVSVLRLSIDDSEVVAAWERMYLLRECVPVCPTTMLSGVLCEGGSALLQ